MIVDPVRMTVRGSFMNKGEKRLAGLWLKRYRGPLLFPPENFVTHQRIACGKGCAPRYRYRLGFRAALHFQSLRRQHAYRRPLEKVRFCAMQLGHPLLELSHTRRG